MNNDSSLGRDVDFVVVKRRAERMPVWQKVSYSLLIGMLVLSGVTIVIQERTIREQGKLSNA